MIKDDMDSNWGSAADWPEAMWSGNGWIEIPAPPPKRGVQQVNLSGLWEPPLREVLEIGLPQFETGYPCSVMVRISTRSSLNELFF